MLNLLRVDINGNSLAYNRHEHLQNIAVISAIFK